MSTESTNAPIAAQKAIVDAAETPEQQPSKRMGEGLGVFRALLLTAILYVAFGFLAWFAWHALMNPHHH